MGWVYGWRMGWEEEAAGGDILIFRGPASDSLHDITSLIHFTPLQLTLGRFIPDPASHHLTAVLWFQLTSPKLVIPILHQWRNIRTDPPTPPTSWLSSQKKFLSSTQIFDMSWTILSHYQLFIMYSVLIPCFFALVLITKLNTWCKV